MTPFDDFVYLINHVLLGEEPTIEDFILLVGTLVAFIAFILWCCFPIQPKQQQDTGQHRQFSCKIIQSHLKTFDAIIVNNENGNGNVNGINNDINGATNGSTRASNSSTGTGTATATAGGIPNTTQYNSNINGSYSKNGTVAMHNYYVKNGHHCCT